MLKCFPVVNADFFRFFSVFLQVLPWYEWLFNRFWQYYRYCWKSLQNLDSQCLQYCWNLAFDFKLFLFTKVWNLLLEAVWAHSTDLSTNGWYCRVHVVVEVREFYISNRRIKYGCKLVQLIMPFFIVQYLFMFCLYEMLFL